jgi:hypothetical protein
VDDISVCPHTGKVEKHSYSTKWPCAGGKAINDLLPAAVLTSSSLDSLKLGFWNMQSSWNARQAYVSSSNPV